MIQIQSFEFSPFAENTYVLYDETNEAVVIDPGCLMQSEKETLSRFIEQEGLKVTMLLQTHAHLDHVFGSAYVKRKYGVKMYMHKNELPILSSVENRCQLWGIRGYEPVEADAFLEEGDVITFGHSTLETLFVPGHAPGHLAFVNHTQRFVIGGDVLFRGSVGRTDFPLCDHAALIRSIQTKFMTLEDDYQVFAGHMEPTTIGRERRTNPFLN
ncbi:MBL fold metallo-hydrolase [Runella slithyformis]|uniref:Beta-lactamase n=1 Tax=Runella slithyformis (strain ATCC 29530 / DSM 19594 / LMG 11500 / NCIMB 11436 / LSU 4) TaxID=761193 RepID=A0A7U3ZMZ8_RUNSL|nr:MBL fold metallo-hydrolase [Runella slithyformis]AEI50147.1 beta-lactamase [Runella slithyformis DSM 19594]